MTRHRNAAPATLLPKTSGGTPAAARAAFLVAASVLLAQPAGAQVGTQSTINLPDSLYYPGDTVAWVKPVPSYCEGPAWHARTGEVTFSAVGSPGSSANRPHWPLWRVKPGVDTGSVFWNLGQGNGQIVDAQGRLVVIQRDVAIRFDRYDSAGAKVDTLVSSGKNGVNFHTNASNDAGAGNDLAVGKRGDFYFSTLASSVYYVDTAGNLSVAATGLNSANGIFWLEDENIVFVHNTSGSNAAILRYDRASDGTLTNRTTWGTFSGYADGGCIDVAGNHWVGDYTNGMIRVFPPAGGQAIGNITLRGLPATGGYNARSGNQGNANNCVFGGPDLKTLYITGDGGLFSLHVKIPGRQLPPSETVSLRPAIPRRAGSAAMSLVAPRDALGRTVREDARVPVLALPGTKQ